MKNNTGYIYVLIHPKISGLVKIETEISRLEGYICAYSAEVSNVILAEERLYEKFRKDISLEHEGFLTTPLHKVIFEMVSIEYGEEQDFSNGFDKNGIHKDTKTKFDLYGLDVDRYNINGFNKEGIHKVTGTKFDSKGFDTDGFNVKGFNIIKIHKDTNTYFDLEGFDINGYNCNEEHRDELSPLKNRPKDLSREINVLERIKNFYKMKK